MEQRQIHGQGSLSLFIESRIWLFCCIMWVLLLPSETIAATEVHNFIGPQLGERVVLINEDGTITKRVCTLVSETGEFYFEERRRLKGRLVTKEEIERGNYPAKFVRILRGEEDILNKFTMRAEEGKLLLHNITFNEESVLLDMINSEWVQHASSSAGKAEMKCKIVNSGAKYIYGDIRSFVDVQMISKKEIGVITRYRLVEGLGVTEWQSIQDGIHVIRYKLKE